MVKISPHPLFHRTEQKTGVLLQSGFENFSPYFCNLPPLTKGEPRGTSSERRRRDEAVYEQFETCERIFYRMVSGFTLLAIATYATQLMAATPVPVTQKAAGQIKPAPGDSREGGV